MNWPPAAESAESTLQKYIFFNISKQLDNFFGGHLPAGTLPFAI